ncbi:hypothetical protein [Mesorhizobium sp. B1-1-7]|uniref:hypothetical protein n=1 Tax=Mesorhizobium sp. B1-1-7 TaxID=2589977 RepID=UPI0011273DA6|nr:hypothetical protein [Mesorhizobium sp. B1-1-7]TPN44860.1 hypothetical protein FJ978_28175 [Mesorhizobium sp. B1-1-7]
MADGFGSKAKPVALDPFQQIVEVHWAGTFLLLTFGLKADSTPRGERGTGPGPDIVTPFSEAFVTTATPAYASAAPAAQIWTGSDWLQDTAAEVTASGAPSPPGASTFADWEVNGVTDGGNYAPFPRFIAGSGSPPDVRLPDAHSYITDLTVNGEMVAQNFISSPQPLPVGGDVPLWATFNPVPAQKATFALDMSGVSAVYKGRTYEPIATRVSGQMEFNTGTLDVLLKRHAA